MYTNDRNAGDSLEFSHRFSQLCERAGAPAGFGAVKFISNMLDVTPKTVSLWLRGESVPKPKMLRRITEVLVLNANISASVNDVIDWLNDGKVDFSTRFDSPKEIVSHEDKLAIYLAVAHIARDMKIDDLSSVLGHTSLEKLFDNIFTFVKAEFDEGNSEYVQSEDFKTLVKAAIWMAQKELI